MASRDRKTSAPPTRHEQSPRRAARWVVAVISVATLTACTSSHPTAAGAAAGSGTTPTSASAGPTGAAAGAAVSSADPASANAGLASAATSAKVASSPVAAPSPLVVAAPTPTPTPYASPSVKPPPNPAPSPTKRAVPTATSTPPATPLLVQQLADVGNAQQAVVVTSSNWSTDVATLQTFEKDAGVWHAVFPAMAANIGVKGFSATKVEGDDKTPAGKFGFGTMFGQLASPGVKFPYRVADAQSVWVDHPSSPYYNTWREDVPLSQGEDLADKSKYGTAYQYAVDIAYNTNPVVPGKGSAIFLHVTTGGGTAGCVSLAKSNLLEVLRWLDPAKAPIIVMAPTSAIRQY